MKTCKVYELTMKEECIPVGRSYMEINYIKNEPHVCMVKDLPAQYVEVDNKYVPVQEFAYSKLPEYIKGSLSSSNVETNYTFLVIDPLLEELVASKYKNTIHKLKEDKKTLANTLNGIKTLSFLGRLKFLFKGYTS